MTKLVILDSYALTPGDLDWSGLRALADEVEEYPRTAYDQLADRIGDADFAVLNKGHIDEAVLAQCPKLRWVGVTATGTDSLDVDACRRRGIPVANVPAYSTHSVAQFTVGLLLETVQHSALRAAAVEQGMWQLDLPAAMRAPAWDELCGKTIGIVGYGDIGRQVAAVARAFGMRVLVHTRTVRPEYEDGATRFVPLEELLAESDVISLHCPATPQTRGLLHAGTLARCRRGVIVLNTARGALVDERAMADALHSGQVGAYAADVAAVEPLPADSPLRGAPHLLLTPHVAWTSRQALARLSGEVCENLRSFLNGGARNVVNGPF